MKSKEAPAAIVDPLSSSDDSSSNNVDKHIAATNDTLHKNKNNHHHTPRLLQLVRRLRPLMYILPYLVGIAWTSLHPLLSIVTGEMKCRGAYIDENGLDVHRYRIPNYPTSRLDLKNTSSSSSTLLIENDNDNTARESKTTVSATDTSTSSKHSNNNKYGMCHTLHRLHQIKSTSLSLSFVDCLTHVTTILPSNDNNYNTPNNNQQQQAVGVSFDIVRIIPTIGPMKDMTEAIVLVVGSSSSSTSRSSSSNRSSSGSTRCSTQEATCNNDNTNNDDNEKWYNNNDMNASIIQLISRLSNSNDCPWLNKVIYILSPNNNNSNNNDDNVSHYLGHVVDAFLSSYLGGDNTYNNHHSTNNHDDTTTTTTTTTMLLPLEYTYPIIRSLIVINDVNDHDDDTKSTSTTTTKSKVKILPQGGINNGILPNLDIFFATTMSFQSQPAINNGQWDRSKSLYYSGISNSGENNNVPHFTTHPNNVGRSTTATTIIEKYTYIVMHYVFVTILGYDSKKLNQYINGMSGMLYFLISMIIGP